MPAEDAMDAPLLQMSKEREIIIELESVPEGLLSDFESREFVRGGEAEEKKVSVKVLKEGDYRRTLSEFLIKKNLIPLSLSLKSFSLEEAFVTITQENVERPAAMEGERLSTDGT